MGCVISCSLTYITCQERPNLSCVHPYRSLNGYACSGVIFCMVALGLKGSDSWGAFLPLCLWQTPLQPFQQDPERLVTTHVVQEFVIPAGYEM